MFNQHFNIKIKSLFFISMPSPLGFSMIDELKSREKEKKTSGSTIDTKRKTRKNRASTTNKKVEKFLASITNNDSDDEEPFGDYQSNNATHLEQFVNNPYARPMPELQQNSQYQQLQPQEYNPNQQQTPEPDDDRNVTTEEFNTIVSDPQQGYYNSYVPYTTNVANTQVLGGEKDMLLEKLNYMIHLLEEQQDEKTGHVTEELILYTFLGVFVIFVIDSFARAGKYVR